MAGLNDVAIRVLAVGVMLVCRETGPAALANGEQFRHKQTADLVVVFCAKDMLDLAVCLRVVRPVLHGVQLGHAHVKWIENLVVTGTCNERLSRI